MGLSCAEAEGTNNEAEKSKSTGKIARAAKTRNLLWLVAWGVVAGF